MANQQLIQTILNPTAQADQMTIEQRQKYADMLRQQAFTPDQGQMVSGHYIAPSWTQGLARLLGGFAATKMDAQNQKDATAINQRTADAMRSAAPDFLPSNQPIQQQPVQSTPDAAPVGGSPNPQRLAQAMLSGNNPPPQMGDPSAQPIPSPQPASTQPSQGAPNPFGYSNLTKAQVIEALGGSQMASAFAKQFEPTDLQRNDRYLGIDPSQTRSTELAKREKEGAISVPDNGYIVMPNGKILWGSDIKGGTFTAAGPDGRPVSVPIQGANENAANRAGLIKRAELGAQDQFAVPSPVNMKGGPVALTPAQQRAAANGGTDPAFPRVTPAEQAGRDGDRARIIRQELAANPNDPALRAEAGRFGIPLESDTDKARASTLVGTQAESLKKLTQDADAMRGMVPVFDQIESLIRKGTVGNGLVDRAQMIGHNFGIRQTPETTNTANLEKLGNQLVLARGSLGAGVSVADAERYDKAAGDFTKAQSNQEKLQYLKIMRDVIEKSYSRANQAISDFSAGKPQSYQTASPMADAVAAEMKRRGLK